MKFKTNQKIIYTQNKETSLHHCQEHKDLIMQLGETSVPQAAE